MFKDFPLQNHAQAPKAHQSGALRGRAGKYWQMHDLIFANQARMEVANLKQHAAALEIDTGSSTLASIATSTPPRSLLTSSSASRSASTPRRRCTSMAAPVVGAQPFEQFQAVIDEELARA